MEERLPLKTVTQCQAENRPKSLNLMAVTEGDYFSDARLKNELCNRRPSEEKTIHVN